MQEHPVPPSGAPHVLPVEGAYNGFYRGTVVENDDRPIAEGGKCKPPVGDDHGPIGRVRVSVPQVYGPDLQPEDLPWAEVVYPCFGGGPDTLGRLAGFIAVPRKGTTVWVGFEQGDPQRPLVFGSWIGKADGKLEVPGEVRGHARTPYAKEKDRTGVQYPQIVVIKPPGGDPDKLGICIQFLEKRVGIYLDEDNWIELDGYGSPAETAADLRAAMIRVHSKNRRIAVTSDLDDPKAILLLANSGGVHIEAEDNVVMIARSGSIVRVAGVSPADTQAKIAEAQEAGKQAKLTVEELLSVSTLPVPAGGHIFDAGKGIRLDVARQGITHAGPSITGAGSVKGAYFHPPLGGHG